MFKELDISYNKNKLLETFSKYLSVKSKLGNMWVVEFNSPKVDSGRLDISNQQEMIDLFYKLSCIDQYSSISFLRIWGETHPHTNVGNAGLVIFPIIGAIAIDCYNYTPPLGNDGKSLLPSNPNNLTPEILDTHYLRHVIVKPIVVDGRSVYRLTRVDRATPVVLIFKIDANKDWTDVKLVT